ncbi:phage tail tube protein [Massilia sp.]|uniref:phage tail tube protein n=1 Tax=Massilia sp. TaxID=1882437 RepID=UPI0028A9A109|nr:phage tail tube protein [Massilia sp.]
MADPRLIRKTTILAKLETTYGLDAAPTGAANALLVSNLSVNPMNAEYISRDIIREYLGGSEELAGARYMECGFDIELVGSGQNAVAPAWGPLMRSIGFAEVITPAMRVDYVPISGAFESSTIYYYDDGVLHKLLGVRGTATLDLGVGKKPVISFKFMGVDGGTTAVPNVSTTLTAWRVPQVVLDANSGKLTFGATHAAATAPAFTGGTPYPSDGLTIDLGIKAQFQKLLGGERISISERDVTGAAKLQLSAVEEVSFLNDIKANKLTSIGLIHGTVANDKVGIFMPAVQLKEPTKEELNGERLIGYKLGIKPKVGNDEIRIFTSFA